MNFKYPKPFIVAGLIGIGFTDAAFAACSADLGKLDSALEGTTLSAQTKGDPCGTRAKAADLFKARDDDGCSKAIMDATAKVGVTLYV
jgi:hypothetical protein